ncbi:MAG: DUF167 domain-containing protein [Ilumatobacter sp.]|nr:DUF167 domain-containing protein [Ilumatobacter sp.]
MMSTFWSTTDTGIVVRVRATPGARISTLRNVCGDHVRIKLAAQPVEGQANDELVRFVAQLSGVRRSAVRIVRGHRSRITTLSIVGPQRPAAKLAGDVDDR